MRLRSGRRIGRDKCISFRNFSSLLETDFVGMLQPGGALKMPSLRRMISLRRGV